jgi:RNA polymerase sigma-70 factor (ECF subfamily)
LALDERNRDACPDAESDFTAIVNAHWTAVYRMLHCLTNSTHDTEDLTQETFLRALKRLDTYRPGTQMRNWLLRIASNAFFDVRRKRGRLKAAPLVDDHPAADQPPEQPLETREESELARAALEELSELTRMVFHLRAEEDLSFKEIADLAGTSEQAARWHMHQARTKLLQRMARQA